MKANKEISVTVKNTSSRLMATSLHWSLRTIEPIVWAKKIKIPPIAADKSSETSGIDSKKSSNANRFTGTSASASAIRTGT
jgi:hypothetical protein